MAYLGKTPSQAVRSRYYFTASGSETSLSGADDNSNTLAFTDGNYVDVSLNGVALVAGTDYNTTTANTIGGLSALAANDVVEIIVYDTFSVFGGNVNADLNFKDNGRAVFGTGGDLKIWHSGSNSFIQESGTGDLYIQGAVVNVTDTSSNLSAKFVDGGAVELYYNAAKKLETTSDGVTITSTDDGSNPSPNLVLYRDSGSPADNDDLGKIFFRGKNDADQDVEYSSIVSEIADASDGTEDARLYFKGVRNGSDVTYMQLKFGQVFVSAGLVCEANISLNPGRTLRFEGIFDDDFETALDVVNPTADRTVYLPDASGTVLLNVSEDTSPQLGGVLDTNGNNIEFGDSTGAEVERLKFGAGDDLHIFHNGSHSFIRDEGTGKLFVQSNEVSITDTSANLSAKFVDGGAVELYHNASKKLETTSTGIDVTGAVTAETSSTGEFNALTIHQASNTSGDEARIQFKRTTDGGSDREVAAIVADRVGGNDTALIFETNTDGSDGATERVRINHDGNVGIGTTSPGRLLTLFNNDQPVFQITNNTSGSASTKGLIQYIASSSTDAIFDNQGTGSGGNFRFMQAGNERVRIDTTGQFMCNFGQSTDVDGKIGGSSGSTTFGVQKTDGLRFAHPGTSYWNKFSDGTIIQFRRAGSNAGSISCTSSGITYNTTSDRRLKTDIEPIADGTDKLMQMQPVTHKWIAEPDGDAVHGFIAQDMQQICPEAVSGEDGGEEMMSMDYGRITPVLVAALQDAHRKIEELEQRLSEMEN